MNQHPDVHLAANQWSSDQVLHVATAYSNPFRWRTRRELANDFVRHMRASANVQLHVVELAYGDRPFEVTNHWNPGSREIQTDVQLRTRSELFHKENLLNLAVRSFPPGWRYGAIVDADFHFARHDFALETIHQLQHHAWVQMFSSYTDLSGDQPGTGHRPIGVNNGFAYNYVQNGFKIADGWGPGGATKEASMVDSAGHLDAATAYGDTPRGRKVGATGGAWAFTREAFDATGGLLDRCILGHGDWFSAFGLVGMLAPDMRIAGYSDDYRQYIFAWQKRAAILERNIGYVDCHALHGFHGPKVNRGYSSRDAILVEHQYSPTRDVAPDWQGVLQLVPGKPGLRDAIRRYFLSRSEDAPQPPV